MLGGMLDVWERDSKGCKVISSLSVPQNGLKGSKLVSARRVLHKASMGLIWEPEWGCGVQYSPATY